MCCVFRDALLHTTVVMCGYLCYCHLPVSFDQSGPSPLTSLINKHVSAHRTAANWMVFCFSHHHSLQTTRDCCAWKSQEISSFWDTQTTLSGTNNHPSVKVTVRSHFFPILTFGLEQKLNLLTTSACFYASRPDKEPLQRLAILTLAFSSEDQGTKCYTVLSEILHQLSSGDSFLHANAVAHNAERSSEELYQASLAFSQFVLPFINTLQEQSQYDLQIFIRELRVMPSVSCSTLAFILITFDNNGRQEKKIDIKETSMWFQKKSALIYLTVK